MKRKCVIIASSTDYHYDYNRHFCVDFENQDAIFKCIKKKEKKFWHIVERTLCNSNLYWDCYAKEKINDKTKNIAAIKFFDAENTRVYCFEKTSVDGNFYIICAIELFSKKVQKNDKRINSIIEKIAGYDYEIIE